MSEIHSDWGDWLPRTIAEADPDGLAIWYLGCNGFVIKSSSRTTVLIDPYFGTGDPPRTVRMIPIPMDPDDLADVDAVLATHEHRDHVHGPSQGPILEAHDADFYAPSASIEKVRRRSWLGEYDIGSSQLDQVREGESLQIGDLTITVEPANDPDAEHPVSYVIDHQAGTFFHGGDARPGAFGPVGERHDIDLGVLAFGSIGMLPDKETREPTRTEWYSNENRIVEAANDLEIDRLIPSHYDMWKGMTADPTVLHNHMSSFDYPKTLDIVEIGDRVTL